MTEARGFLLSTVVCLCVLLLGSCRHQSLFPDEPEANVRVKVEFDWSGAPSASPAEMTVYFYRRDDLSRAPRRYILDFKNIRGGYVSLPPGVYDALCHNADGTVHRYVGIDGHPGFGIRLNDMRGYDVAGGEERVAYAPEPLWVASVTGLSVGPPAGDDAAWPVAGFAMQSVVYDYTFIILHPVNLSPDHHRVTAMISGLAGTVHPGGGVTGDETVRHVFGMSTGPEGQLTGHVLTFGHCPGQPLRPLHRGGGASRHILTVEAAAPGGKPRSYTFDVTDRIHGSREEDCVIVIDSIILPPYTPPAGGGGGGFRPSVGDWVGSQEQLGM